MTDPSERPPSASPDEEIHILHVDDDPDFADMAAQFLQRENDRFRIDSLTAPAEALAEISSDIDCIISDFDMPGSTGIDFLKRVRARDEHLPFILFTGKGSEEVASDAIAAGVTDYIQKSADSSQYTILANRIENSVAQNRSRQELARTERRYRRLIEKSTDVITVVDEAGDFTYLSPSAAELMDYSPDDLVGENAFEYVHPDDREELAERFATIVEDPDRQETAEFRFRRPDGSWAWLEARGRNLLADEAIDGIVVYARDVSERKAHQAEIARSYDLLRHTEDIANTGGWEADLETEEVRWTDGTKRIHEVPLDYVPSIDEAIAFYRPADQPRIRAAVSRCAERGEPFDEELRITTANGRERRIRAKGEPFEEDGEIRSLRGAIQDITGLEERERELAEIRDRMEYVLEVTDSIIWEADLESRAVTRHGPFEQLFGVDPESVPTSAEFRETVVHPDDREALREKHEAADRGNEQVSEHIYRTNPRFGDERWILERPYVRLGNSDAGDQMTVVGLSTDVTEQMDRERDLERHNRQLEEVSSIVSHDLGNPLSMAITRLELYHETSDPDHLDAVERLLYRMDELAEHLLDVIKAGQSSIDEEPVDLANVAEVAWEVVDGPADALSVDSGTIIGDSVKLRSLFENLFANAITHGDSPSTVRVGPLPDGFYVEDTGRGIPPDERDRIFQKGYSTDPDGTGWGMTIIQHIADAHGFDVTVGESAEGGARFEFVGGAGDR